MGLFEYHCLVFPTKISSHLMVETSKGNAKNTKYVYVDSVVKGTFFQKIVRYIKEHWRPGMETP